MGLIELIGRGISAWSDSTDLLMVGTIGADTVILENVPARIEELTKSYIKDRSPANQKRVEAILQPTIKFLERKGIEGHTLFDIPVDLTSSAGFMVKTQHAIWARQLLLEIALLRSQGSLPEGPVKKSPAQWRVYFQRQREAYMQMGMQFERLVKERNKDLKRILEYKTSLLKISREPGTSRDQISMINADIDQQEVDERRIEAQIKVFTLMASHCQSVVARADTMDRVLKLASPFGN